LWLNLERTLDKRRRKVKAKKVITSQRAMTKGSSVFTKKQLTPSVAAPGDTNLCEAVNEYTEYSLITRMMVDLLEECTPPVNLQALAYN